jgi:hypothetical protein
MTLAYGRRMAPPTPVPSCDDQDFCLICSDEAVPVRVVELLVERFVSPLQVLGLAP